MLAAAFVATSAYGSASPAASIAGIYKGNTAGADSMQHWTLKLAKNGSATRDIAFDMTRTAAGTPIYPSRNIGTWEAAGRTVTVTFRTALNVGQPHGKPFPSPSTLTLVARTCELREPSRPGVPARFLVVLHKMRCVGGVTL